MNLCPVEHFFPHFLSDLQNHILNVFLTTYVPTPKCKRNLWKLPNPTDNTAGA